MARVDGLPASVDADAYRSVYELARQIHSDDALIAFRSFMEGSVGATLDELLDTATWLARETYVPSEHAALAAGAELRNRLDAVTALEAQLAAAGDADQRDKVLDALKNARALLTRTRAVIDQNAQAWRLRLLKTSIRSYHEVARASFRNR